ncbi:ankyrin repeat domain-containing protein [Streptomyces sp. VRA16 Mangrove soil]|uniref:ankyrin repeat domain-containing protein n=1 Tax=Streptomyces sp. VRA16 Mangrove soil TaxID=2817434 RepID=UPI001A9D8822|nr:ankyrin repeat domain-containing protein [Streptomyces sp. VRA16 Mangrove soil]MBO1329880.1 ankyrin repeat domain-containing protein [Streptomyces sp. VRA16 Mangrove soil]
MSSARLTAEQTARVVAIAMDLAREGSTGQLVEFVRHGLPVDTADAGGDTLLMLAAYHGHADTVRALLRLGADPDLRNARDQSPVAGALFKGADDVVAALRGAGADLDSGTPTARAAAALFGREHLLTD